MEKVQVMEESGSALGGRGTGSHVESPGAVGAMLGDAEVEISIEIARRSLTILELIELREGDVIEFRAPVSARVAVVAAGAVVATGELVDVEGALGVRITELGGSHRG